MDAPQRRSHRRDEKNVTADSNADYDDDLYDPYAEGGGPAGAPVVSWKYSRVGDSFTAIVVPPKPLKRPDKGYRMSREYQQGTDTDPDDKGFMVWPPKNNPEKIKRPVTDKKFAELWPDLEVPNLPGPNPKGVVSRTDITFATAFGAGEFISDNAKLRMQDDETDLATVTDRRVILSSQDLREKANAELKRIRAADGAPQVGQTWTITIAAREPNKGKPGTTTRYEVHIDPPTDETKAVVQAYVDSARAAAGADEDSQDESDPYVGPAAVKAEAEQKPPPF
jgi:hypothetical protein